MSDELKAALLRAMVLIFVAFVLLHWLTAGHDEIIEGPPETPDTSFYQPDSTP